MLDFLWMARNKLLHEDIQQDPPSIIQKILHSHSNGDILHAWTSQSTTTDPLIGEADAALLALSKAVDLKINSLLFQGDCAILLTIFYCLS